MRRAKIEEQDFAIDQLDTDYVLSEGWATGTLKDLIGRGGILIDGDWIESKDQDPDGDIRLIQLADIGDGIYKNKSSRFLTSEKAKELACTFLKPGDVLIARMPEPLGRACIFPGDPKPAVTAVDICIVRSGEGGGNHKWIRYIINSPAVRRRIEALQRGTTRKRISRRNLVSLILPIPPLNEQKRIVAKVEELLARVNSAKERLGKVSMIIKRFRQAVLTAACSGRLTEDWREDNQSPPNYGEGELPLGWRTTLVGEVIESLKYGTSQKCSYGKRGVPVLRIPNIDQGVISHSDLKYAALRDKEFQQLCLQPGDILMIRSNGSVSLVGRTALLREIDKGFAYAGYLIRLRADFSKIIPDFLNLILGSHDVRIQIEVPARSTSGVHNINSEEVRALQFFLPPIREQQEIVRQVEAMFKLAGTVEKRVTAASVRAEKVTQAILAKAFRGELVPTEAELARREVRSYESASDVLARIKSGRESKAALRKIPQGQGCKRETKCS